MLARLIGSLERSGRFGMRPGLETMRALLGGLGDPQDALACLHVAGTNGKGDVCALADSVLRAAGYRCGRYVSPHLVALNERFGLDGAPAADGALAAAADEVLDGCARLPSTLHPTYFELLTAIAFVLYARAGVDFLVLETGLGGRLDATNVIRAPRASAITRVGLDHCAWLGGTVAAIAGEKAGILKPGCPAVLGAMPKAARTVVLAAARGMGCPIFEAEPTRGNFRAENRATAHALFEALRATGAAAIPPAAEVEGMARAFWPGRFQFLARGGVTAVVDGAHNPPGARALAAALAEDSRTASAAAAKRLAFVCGFCADKDVAADLAEFAAVGDSLVAVPLENPRTLPAEDVARLARAAGFREATAAPDFAVGFARAAARARDSGAAVVVAGSLFLAGTALREWGELSAGDSAAPNERIPLAPDERLKHGNERKRT